MNSHVAIEPIFDRLNDENAENLLQNSDIIIDGCDNFATRYAINDAARSLQIPYISASLLKFGGQITTLFPHQQQNDGTILALLPLSLSDHAR